MGGYSHKYSGCNCKGLVKRLMQGQILSASVTGNQGVILGDDGVQYSFTATDWRDNSEKAASGMRVDFSGQGFFATEVRSAHSVNYAVSAPPNPVPSASSPPVGHDNFC